jgi:(p)ppGpp synthase/HD superfamily hydrolase
MSEIWRAYKARCFAIAAHGDQVRKYTGEPYWFHLEEVAIMVRLVGGSPAMVAAAWLHDTVEDTSTSLIFDIYGTFGQEVGDLVDALTDVSKPEDGNRKTRKQLDLDHIAKASPNAKTIKLADIISNTRSITHYDPEFAKVYIPERLAMLAVLGEGDQRLFDVAMDLNSLTRSALRRSKAASVGEDVKGRE